MELKNPDYNPDGKKLTWAQHMKKKEKYEASKKKQTEKTNGHPAGRCRNCHGGHFRLRCLKGGTIEQTCRKCGNTRDF